MTVQVIHCFIFHQADSLRRFFKKQGALINPEYNIDLTKFSISDYGNIYIADEPSASLE